MKLTMGELRRIIHEEVQVADEQLDEGPMDWLQGALDVAGLIPGIGEAADGVNALISIARGNPLEAALSLVSMIPVAGDAVGKGGKAALKMLDPAIDIIKNAGPIADVVEKIGPDAAKNLGKVIGPLKDVVLKNSDKIQAHARQCALLFPGSAPRVLRGTADRHPPAARRASPVTRYDGRGRSVGQHLGR